MTVYVDDIRLTDISTRSEYVRDIWVLKNKTKVSTYPELGQIRN